MQTGLDDLPEPGDLHARLARTRPLDWGEPIPTKAEIAGLYGSGAAVESLTLLTRAAEVEAELTDELVASIRDGTTSYQLESRLKSPQSLARKIRKMAGTQFSKQPLDDVVRYTIVTSDPDDLVPASVDVHDSLHRHGWTINGAVHSYAEGSRYKGLHLHLQKHGQRVELQLHSHESIEVKDRTTPLYVVERDSTQPREKRADAREAAIALSAQMRQPRGIDDLTALGGVPVEVRVYGRQDRRSARPDRATGPTSTGRSAAIQSIDYKRKGGMAK
ncbi:hypothetical protein JOF29_001521 [Kribbella aluminosa]|uniref:Uncharacterized protein n=1 Tax=Kribbella aluminosa TaxID=416017 RepID=A0ABS4UFK3_9ACTN|nr:hypothetical protein [Kribbella aluminosa]MBP2350438.1 hypothetical protein [Kribbella aluminosa]